MNNTTRISDLPENVTMQINKPNNLIDGEQSTNYIPINVHPNPYGVSPQNPIMPPHQQPPLQKPLQKSVVQEQINEEQMRELKEMRQVNLPSKHVKIDTQNYLQDEEEIKLNESYRYIIAQYNKHKNDVFIRLLSS